MPRTPVQFEAIREEKRKLILETALELFAENGYYGTSISHITKKAGISKGLLYNYFESKEDVLKSIIQSGYEAAYNHLELNQEGMLVQDEFIHFLRMTFKAIQENRHFWQLYSALMFQQGILDVALSEYEGKALEIQKLMTDFLKAMGSIAPETDLLAISSLIKGASVILMTAPDFFPADKLETTIIDSCFRLITTGENSGKKERQAETGKMENIITIQR